MRTSQGLRRIAAVMILLLVAASALLWADESGDLGDCFGLRMTGGATGFPLTTANAKIEAAAGLCDFALAAWLELPYLPYLDLGATAGGAVTLSLDWLSVSARLSRELALRQNVISFVGRAAPPAWLLYSGSPSLLGGVTVTATVTDGPQWSFDGNGLTLSPYITAVLPLGDVLLSSTIGFDAQIGSGNGLPSVSGLRVISTVDAGIVDVTNTVEFAGALDALAAVSLSLSLPQAGLTLTGSYLPSAIGAEASYQLIATYVFGNQSLLPFVSGSTGLECTGDTCFVP